MFDIRNLTCLVSVDSVCVHLFRQRHLQEGPGTRPPAALQRHQHHRYCHPSAHPPFSLQVHHLFIHLSDSSVNLSICRLVFCCPFIPSVLLMDRWSIHHPSIPPPIYLYVQLLLHPLIHCLSVSLSQRRRVRMFWRRRRRRREGLRRWADRRWASMSNWKWSSRSRTSSRWDQIVFHCSKKRFVSLKHFFIDWPVVLQSTVDKLLKKTNLALVIGTNTWREQFVEAITVSSGKNWPQPSFCFPVSLTLTLPPSPVQVMTMTMNVARRSSPLVLTTSCTSSLSSGSFCSPSSLPQTTGMVGPASSSLSQSSACWRQ